MDLKQLLIQALKQLPEQPGIYFMKNSSGTVIYVGKAKNLKARVSQYFQKKKDNSPKVKEMIENIGSFEYITTDTELEAFLTECRTIRELKPKYNRQLKNYKGYMYIRLSCNEEYPKLSKVTRQKRDRAVYFGPFTSEGSVDGTIQFIKDHYPIRKCSSGVLKKNSSGCLNFHLGGCLGPCRGVGLREEYGKLVQRIIQFLEGNDKAPVRNLTAKMKSAADSMDFEKAAQYRDQLRGVRHVLNKQRLIKASGYGRNIIAAEKIEGNTVKLFFIKGNKLLHMETVKLNEYSSGILEEKLRNLTLSCFIPARKNVKVNLTQEEIDEAQIIHSYLKNKNNGIISFKIPASKAGEMNYKKIVEAVLQQPKDL